MTYEGYEIQQSLYDSPLIKQKYLKNNQCLLGYKTMDLMLNGVKYSKTAGFHINPAAKSVSVGFADGREVNVTVGEINGGTVAKEGQVIVVTTK